MSNLQKQLTQNHQSKIAVIGDTLEKRLDHLTELAINLSKDGDAHLLTALDRYRQCGQVLLAIKGEFDASKDKWRKLHWREKEKHPELEPKVKFSEHIREKLPFSEDTASFYMSVEEGWKEYRLDECKTLTEALIRMGKIKERSTKIKAQIKSEEKCQDDLDRLSSQYEVIEKVVVVETLPVEVEQPSILTKFEFEEEDPILEEVKPRLENPTIKNQQSPNIVVESVKQQNYNPKLQQVTVFDKSAEERSSKAEEELKIVREQLKSKQSVKVEIIEDEEDEEVIGIDLKEEYYKNQEIIRDMKCKINSLVNENQKVYLENQKMAVEKNLLEYDIKVLKENLSETTVSLDKVVFVNSPTDSSIDIEDLRELLISKFVEDVNDINKKEHEKWEDIRKKSHHEFEDYMRRCSQAVINRKTDEVKDDYKLRNLNHQKNLNNLAGRLFKSQIKFNQLTEETKKVREAWNLLLEKSPIDKEEEFLPWLLDVLAKYE